MRQAPTDVDIGNQMLKIKLTLIQAKNRMDKAVAYLHTEADINDLDEAYADSLPGQLQDMHLAMFNSQCSVKYALEKMQDATNHVERLGGQLRYLFKGAQSAEQAK